jgi:uncharacterized protein DUF2442
MFDIVDARYVSEYIVWLRFEDGTQGEVDLSAELYGPVFEPLKDQALFSQVRVNPDTGTIEWPNKADFAPEFLYERVHVTA